MLACVMISLKIPANVAGALLWRSAPHFVTSQALGHLARAVKLLVLLASSCPLLSIAMTGAQASLSLRLAFTATNNNVIIRNPLRLWVMSSLVFCRASFTLSLLYP